MLRVFFYVLHRAVIADETTQKNGIVFLGNVANYDIFAHFDRILSKKMKEIVMEALPMQVKAVHICASVIH